MKNTIIIPLIAVFFSISSSVFSQENTWDFLENSENNLKAFVKTRASLDSNEHTIYYWEGTIYSYIKGEQSKPLFNLKAYSIARAVPHKNGYYLLTREAGIYTHIETGKIINKWYNPFVADSVEVLPIWNNPVNQNFILKSSRGEWLMDYALLGEDKVCFFADIFLKYPSPVKKAEFPEYIQDDTYQAGEMFQFFVNKKDIANTKLKNIGCDISWTRVSQFLPWMKMGNKEGNLVYHCRGYKLKKGFESLPKQLKEFVMKEKPEFSKAPEKYTKPNETSWTYFKKMKSK